MGLAWASPVGVQAVTRERRWGGPTKAPLSHAAARIATPRHHCTHCSVPGRARVALYRARQIQSVAWSRSCSGVTRPAWVPRPSSAVRLARLGNILCVDEGWWGLKHVPATLLVVAVHRLRSRRGQGRPRSEANMPWPRGPGCERHYATPSWLE